jgi:hypothetical protein
MSSERKSFIIHKDSLSILDDLTDEQAGKLFKAIKSYHDNTEYQVDNLIKIAMSPFKNQFDRDAGKYTDTVERNRINGLKGGRPRSEPNPSKPKEPTGLIENPTKPKKADSDSKSGNDSGSESDNKKTGRFTPPSLQEVVDYCKERSNNVDPNNFIDHYESNGWVRGKTKIKDWKACVRTWEKNSQQPTAQQQERKKPRGFGE